MKRILTLAAAGLLAVFSAVSYLQPARAADDITVRSIKIDGQPAAEVLFKKKVALRFTGRAGNLDPAERADLVAGRLRRIENERPLRPSEVKAVHTGGQSRVTVRGEDLLSISSEDARLAGKSVAETADAWASGLSDAISGFDAVEPPKAAGEKDDEKKTASADKDEYYPELKKKLVPIISAGSSLSVGVAQVQGEEKDVNRVKVVAQLETDYKDWARIKILVPVQSENLKSIDRVPGVSVSAIADYKLID